MVAPDGGPRKIGIHPRVSSSGFQLFPGLMVRSGLSDRMDLGVYFTKAPGANYGFYGAQLQRSLIGGSRSASSITPFSLRSEGCTTLARPSWTLAASTVSRTALIFL